MCSRDATLADLTIVASWIRSRRECELWAGPGVRFPLERPALAAQIDMMGAMNVAMDDRRGLAAFGQALRRPPGQVHLARVIVRPDARGDGVGRALVEALLSRAEESGSTLATLNVARDNAPAVNLYTDVGFRLAERAEGDSVSSATLLMQRVLGDPPTASGTRHDL